MENQIQIFPVDSVTFELQTYSSQDTNIISSLEVDTTFSQSVDYIEYYVYDENQNLIYPDTTQELYNFTVKDGDINLSPDQNLAGFGFDNGTYFITYNFYRKRLASSISQNYYITEISADRTELKLNSSQISGIDISTSVNEFIQYRNSQDYFVDFYLNFGNNNLVIANNLQLDTNNPDNIGVLIKLYEPLPSEFDIKSLTWVVEKISEPQSYQVIFPTDIEIPSDFEYISGPNFNLNLKGESGVSGESYSLSNLVNSEITSSYNQLQSLLNEKGLEINVNYENFSEFIHFSSAKTRLENFYYKVGLIESASNSINSLSSISADTTALSSSIQNIIKNFDGYEYFLYYNSGSQYSWPKSNNEPPYQLYSTGSSQVLNWIGSADPESPYYGGIALSASNYDQDNQDWLYWAIPEYLRNDPDNLQYELFVDMIGQHFDNIWIYTKDVTNKFSADNRLDYGISKDLVADAIKDFGVKLYSNNFNTNDLYTAFLGITPSGSLFPYPDQTNTLPTPSGSEYVNTLISASNDIIPLDDVNKSLYKRIYHNLPYLLKTKGTIAGLRALITSYGIPDTILRINEFGGKDRNNDQDWDLQQRVFNYALNLDGTNFVSSSFNLNDNFTNLSPKTLQFRFKAPGIPTDRENQILWAGDTNKSLILLEYTGSGYISGSYSGSIPSPENEYAFVKFLPEAGNNPANSASVYLPVFNGDWWSVQVTVGYETHETASIYVANEIDGKIGFSGSETKGVDVTYWTQIDNSQFPLSRSFNIAEKTWEPFSGSIQEIRYFSSLISSSVFYDYVVNPYSFEANGVNGSEDQLAFRADLGSMLDTGSRTSIHPRVSGSNITSSFDGGDSSYYISSASFIPNVEIIYQDQTPSGIKNRVTDKVSLEENILPTGDTLSPYISLQQTPAISQSYTPDINYLEIAFSPQDQINDDINSQIGYFNIGDYIGDPRQISQSGDNYPNLDTLRDTYFEKYLHSYDVKDFIRLIKFFDNSLFKMIKDFTPARTSLSSGVVVKQHLLERNRVRPAQITTTEPIYSGSIKPQSRNYNTGSGDTGQYEYNNGSSIYRFKGGTGGVLEPYNGLNFYSSSVDNRFNITQSWNEYIPTVSGSTLRVVDSQKEFYDGEFSGSSPYIHLQRGLGNEDDPCATYTLGIGDQEYLYQVAFFSGSDTLFTITSQSIPTPLSKSIEFEVTSSGFGIETPIIAITSSFTSGSVSIANWNSASAYSSSDSNNILISQSDSISIIGTYKPYPSGSYSGSISVTQSIYVDNVLYNTTSSYTSSLSDVELILTNNAYSTSDLSWNNMEIRSFVTQSIPTPTPPSPPVPTGSATFSNGTVVYHSGFTPGPDPSSTTITGTVTVSGADQTFKVRTSQQYNYNNLATGTLSITSGSIHTISRSIIGEGGPQDSTNSITLNPGTYPYTLSASIDLQSPLTSGVSVAQIINVS